MKNERRIKKKVPVMTEDLVSLVASEVLEDLVDINDRKIKL
jgi:hypothetical protein